MADDHNIDSIHFCAKTSSIIMLTKSALYSVCGAQLDLTTYELSISATLLNYPSFVLAHIVHDSPVKSFQRISITYLGKSRPDDKGFIFADSDNGESTAVVLRKF